MYITREIHRGLLSLQEEERQKHLCKNFDGKFYATEASYITLDGNVLGSCARKIALNKLALDPNIVESFALTPEEPVGMTLSYIFEFGKSFERINEKSLKKAGLTVLCNGKFTIPIEGTPYYVSCEYDQMVKDPETGEYVGMELKTGHGQSYTMKRVLGYKRSPNTKEFEDYTTDPTKPSPDPTHLLQASLYLYKYQVQPDPEIGPVRYWKLLYMPRNTLEVREFTLTLENVGNLHFPRVYTHSLYDGVSTEEVEEVPIIPISIEAVLNRFKEIGSYVDQRIVPAAEFHPELTEDRLKMYQEMGYLSDTKLDKMMSGKLEKSDWQCNYCKWKDQCAQWPTQSFAVKKLAETY